jgi:hypothetical protein
MTDTITTYSYDSWDTFKTQFVHELYDDGIFRRGAHFFRGVGSADWRLETSFDRRFSSFDGTERVALWQSLLESFRSVLTESSMRPETYADDLAALALGQHNGLPTRLLDWTVSPYIATYFAFRHALNQDFDPTQRVAVWVLHTGSTIWSRDFGVELVALEPTTNERLRAQHGRFTYHRTPHACLEDYVTEMGVTDALAVATLPVHTAIQAIPDLEAMGVHAGALFPDLSGIAEAATIRATYSHLADTLRR